MRAPRADPERSVGSGRRARAPARSRCRRRSGSARPSPRSTRSTKYVQERLTLTLAPAYGMEGVALRLWNVYGPGQALSNPYTGVLAIFASRLHNGKPPMIFEDGQQRRDFVHVEDVAQAFVLALEHPKAAGEVFNIGSGEDRSVQRGRRAARAGDGPAGPRARDHRQGARRRHPPLHRRYRQGSQQELGFAPRRDFARGPRRARRMGRAAGGRGPRRTRPARSSKREGSSHDGGERLGAPARRAGPVLITGGAGFIGSNLADRLAREGHDVLVYDALARPGRREQSRLAAASATRSGSRAVIGDIRDETRRRGRGAGRRGGVPLRRAGRGHDEPRRPARGFRHQRARHAQPARGAAPRGNEPAPLIFASTNKVYGDLADIALDETERRLSCRAIRRCARTGIGEDRPLDFHTPYGCSKGAADQYVLDYARSFGVPTAVLRMSCIYGPRQMGTEDQGWVAHFLIRALEGEPITHLRRRPAGARRPRRRRRRRGLSRGVARASTPSQGRAFNLGGGPANAVSLRQLLAPCRGR